MFIFLENTTSATNSNEHLTMNLQQLGDRLYPKVSIENTLLRTKLDY